MLETSQVELQRISVHALGNKARDEGYTATATEFAPDGTMTKALCDWFLKGFKAPEFYKFDIAQRPENPVLKSIARIFETPDSFHLESVALLKHLYNCSEHNGVKAGELFVVLFDGLILEGEETQSIGIFKCEQKERFLLAKDRKNHILLDLLEGIDLRRTDKACLIFNTEAESGYRLAALDNSHGQLPGYWMDDFLGCIEDHNDIYLTRHVVDLCRDFSEDIVARDHDKKEQALFMARSMQFLKEHEEVNLSQMAEEIIPENNIELRHKFMEYRDENESLFGDLSDEAPIKISQTALKREKKKIKSNIRLDNQIEIRINPESPEHATRYIEKGFDELKGLHFYKIYFNNEQ
ncbi:MAG: nucleoid-associated protein [Flavobacteriales bacterium]|nr:nucleoid-associated protein [Flavobacteriales bacterium]